MELTIKQWMALKDVTVRELSEKTGVSEATICHIRMQKTKPRVDTLQRITKVLGITLAEVRL